MGENGMDDPRSARDAAERPRIGVTLMLDAPEGGFPSPRYSMSRAYFAAIRAAGGVPVALVPGALDELPLYLAPQRGGLALDGLCLTGGGDLDPRYFGEERHGACQEPDRERDLMEVRILDLARERAIPVLAICRGFQILNAYHGGTLCQDLAALRPGAFKHDYFKGYPRDMLAHEVSIEPHSGLARIAGPDPLPVNSFHHQALGAMAPGWRATAWSADGLVEAMEPAGEETGSENARFLLAVQWHPECLIAYERHRRIFAAFLSAAARFRTR